MGECACTSALCICVCVCDETRKRILRREEKLLVQRGEKKKNGMELYDMEAKAGIIRRKEGDGKGKRRRSHNEVE